ncbi:hypothetical protein WR25_12455 [Diploscapter pachys]|uniref:7TM GPCR serpentine receptor class x (Srx) domain-containing protein n=1 Tax=Diploscapter pachys TaxID=2018661 RepID=A0A2A2LKU4_9BILA|nr:hypothetical protein WR25_12455 [Diploscapter pachys]
MLDYQLVATIIFLIAGCGMMFNWFITIFIRRLKSLQNPFGRLTGSQAIGEAIHQTVFALYVAPMVFLYAEFIKNCSFVVIICTIDIITVLRVHLFNVSMKTATSNHHHDKKRREEINFLKQVCLQAFIFTLELITCFIMEPHFADPWVKFCMATVAWNLVHATDGFITIFFNKEFRTVIPYLEKQTSIVSSGNWGQKDAEITPIKN